MTDVRAPQRLSVARVMELVRYYQAGAVNAAFGFGFYAALVWLGVNPYGAQLLAHITGVGFNYLTYSRHVFRGAAPAKLRFVISYTLNYVMSFSCLALMRVLVESPYIAGFGAIVIVSIVNYVVLRRLVFISRSGQQE